MGRTKALVEVCGRPLIEWHLRLLHDVEDVVVVVGYQAQDLIEVARQLRPDLVFALNRDWATTGTAASLTLGARGARGDVLSLDGDLLVHPEDLGRVLTAGEPSLGVGTPTTSDAVYALVEDGVVRSFNRSGEGLEWTGLVLLPASKLHAARAAGSARGHVFELLEPHLPMSAVEVRTREVDTAADYDRAVAWLRPISHLW